MVPYGIPEPQCVNNQGINCISKSTFLLNILAHGWVNGQPRVYSRTRAMDIYVSGRNCLPPLVYMRMCGQNSFMGHGYVIASRRYICGMQLLVPSPGTCFAMNVTISTIRLPEYAIHSHHSTPPPIFATHVIKSHYKANWKIRISMGFFWHTMDLLWEKFQWILPLYMKPISFQSKASVVCSVTAAIFIDFCLKKLNGVSQHIGKKTIEYLNSAAQIPRNWNFDQLSVSITSWDIT